MPKFERDREAEREWAKEQLENLRTTPPPLDNGPLFENEYEITHPPGERAILPFRMLSPGDSDYITLIDRWLEHEEEESADN